MQPAGAPFCRPAQSPVGLCPERPSGVDCSRPPCTQMATQAVCDSEPGAAAVSQALPALGRPDPRYTPSAWREVAGLWLAQPPLSDSPRPAGAGLLCIANALVKEVAALSERGLINFGFVVPVLQVQLHPLTGSRSPGPPGRAPWSLTEGFASSLCHFLGPIQVAVRVVEMFREIDGGAGPGPVPRTRWLPSLVCPSAPWASLWTQFAGAAPRCSEVGCLLTEGETEAQKEEVSGSPGTRQ